MGYEAERCPGCGRSVDDYDEQQWGYSTDPATARRFTDIPAGSPVREGGEDVKPTTARSTPAGTLSCSIWTRPAMT